jgi:phosphate transport system permease protein
MLDNTQPLAPANLLHRVDTLPKPRRRRLLDAATTVSLWVVALCTIAVLLWIIGEITYYGAREALSWSYWSTLPSNAGREGGISSLLVSTVGVLGLAMLLAVPMGFLCAIWLSEAKETLASRWVRRALSVLSSLPSLVVGLFGLAFFHEIVGLRVSILLGGLTAGVMVLPIFTRGVEEGLRQVPNELKAGAAALGVGKVPTLFKIALPSAAPAIGASLALAMGRVFGESAALLLTAGPSLRMPDSIDDQGRVLAYHIYMMASEIPGGGPRAYSAAFALVLLVIVVNIGAAYLSERALTQEAGNKEQGTI